jgi:hypothetical protein
MKKIKLSKEQVRKLNGSSKVQQGTAYKHKISNDFGAPLMRQNTDISSQNNALRVPLTKPKIKKRNQKAAQIWNDGKFQTFKEVSVDHPKAYNRKSRQWEEL